MKKVLICMLVLSICFGLFSCSSTQDDGIPDGYQRVSTIEENGFALYVPIGWISYEMGSLVCAYASARDRSSVSVGFVQSALSPKAYFEASAAEFTARYESYNLVLTSEKSHGEKEAYTVDYTFVYEKVTYGTTQRIIDAGDGVLCVITCQAVYDKQEGAENSPYAAHQTTFAGIQDYLELGAPQAFVEPTFEGSAPEGMKRACDSKVIGAVLCVPTEWKVQISDGLVLAKAEDGTNVSLAQARPSVQDIDAYLTLLFDQVKALYGANNVTSIFKATQNDKETVGGATAYRHEYTVCDGDQTYHITQYVVVRSSNIYLLTFTADETLQSSYSETLTKIAQAVMFE